MKILLITSSGGGGLLQSAVAIEQEEKDKNKDVKIIKRDLLLDWIPFKMGFIFTFVYNYAQRKAWISLLNFLVKLNIYGDMFFFPFVFTNVIFLLFRKKISRVIDNQPVCPKAVIKAIRIYNFFSKKKIVLEKVLVDLPTLYYAQFLKSIKRISKKDKKYLKIISIEPLLEDVKTDKEYWEKYCDISKDIVEYKNLVRRSFKKYQNIEKPKKKINIFIRTSCQLEKELIKKCLKNLKNIFEEEKKLFFTIEPKDKLLVILLGSQVSFSNTYQYVKIFIEKIKSLKENYFLFVFADKFKKKNKNLFYKILSIIEKEKNFPKNLHIIPISFQKDDVIASLFHRSDFTITKSGGNTILELMAAAKGKKYIHFEKNNFLKGISFWEAGNAIYLRKKFQANFINPSILKDILLFEN